MDNITVVILVRMDSPIVQVAPMMDAGVTPNSITLNVLLRFKVKKGERSPPFV